MSLVNQELLVILTFSLLLDIRHPCLLLNEKRNRCNERFEVLIAVSWIFSSSEPLRFFWARGSWRFDHSTFLFRVKQCKKTATWQYQMSCTAASGEGGYSCLTTAPCWWRHRDPSKRQILIAEQHSVKSEQTWIIKTGTSLIQSSAVLLIWQYCPWCNFPYWTHTIDTCYVKHTAMRSIRRNLTCHLF
jgi:hypothetical protein